MAVAIAVAWDHVLDGVRHLVGDVVNAVLQPVSTLFDFILDAVGGAGCVVSRIAQLVTHVVAAVMWSCLGQLVTSLEMYGIDRS